MAYESKFKHVAKAYKKSNEQLWKNKVLFKEYFDSQQSEESRKSNEEDALTRYHNAVLVGNYYLDQLDVVLTNFDIEFNPIVDY